MNFPAKQLGLFWMLSMVFSLSAGLGCGQNDPLAKKDVKRSQGGAMGVLTDIFVSSPADAAKYESRLRDGRLDNCFEVVQFRGLTNLEFGTLWAIIEKKDFDFDKDALESLAPQKETWLFRFPERFVKALASLTPATIKKVAESWANTEELQWNPSEAQEVLVELLRLAKLA